VHTKAYQSCIDEKCESLAAMCHNKMPVQLNLSISTQKQLII
jgi:hypothetical protein